MWPSPWHSWQVSHSSCSRSSGLIFTTASLVVVREAARPRIADRQAVRRVIIVEPIFHHQFEHFLRDLHLQRAEWSNEKRWPCLDFHAVVVFDVKTVFVADDVER